MCGVPWRPSEKPKLWWREGLSLKVVLGLCLMGEEGICKEEGSGKPHQAAGAAEV